MIRFGITPYMIISTCSTLRGIRRRSYVPPICEGPLLMRAWGRVVSLEVHPLEDTFMSGSMDNTVRLWDMRSPNCRVSLSFGLSPRALIEGSSLGRLKPAIRIHRRIRLPRNSLRHRLKHLPKNPPLRPQKLRQGTFPHRKPPRPIPR